MKTMTDAWRMGAAMIAMSAFSVGCAADPVASATVKPLTTEGSFAASIDGKKYTVDYTGMTAKVEMNHKPSKEGKACIGTIKLTMAGENDACKLMLEFSRDFDGAMVLENAEFHSKVAEYQGETPIYSYPCDMWADESKYAKGHKPLVYRLNGGDGRLNAAPLAQPEASMTKATLRDYTFNPKGTIGMQFKGRTFEMSLDDIVIKGDAISVGDDKVSCAADYTSDVPEISLKNVNKLAETMEVGEEFNFPDDIKGKFAVVHMGAGWCASCVSQVEYMEDIKKEMKGAGRNDIIMVSINAASANSPENQDAACGLKKKATFPVLQEVGGDGWKSFIDCKGRKGKKNDGFVFAPDGRFIRKHEGKGTVYMNVWQDDVRAGLNTKIEDLDNCECADVKDAPKKVHHTACK